MLNRQDSLEGMTVFVQVIESGSFSAAASVLGHAVSHISKTVSRLEDRLGARLINRTTRSLSLTDVGQVYFEKARQIVADAREAEQSINHMQDKPTGRLKISLPSSFGQSHMQPLIRDYMLKYPDVNLQIDFSSRLVDVIGEGFDLCVRMGTAKSSNLISRNLLNYKFLTIATPEYFAKNPKPETPQDLKNHQAIKYMYNQVPITWEYIKDGQETVHIDVKNKVECNNIAMQKTLIMAGLGIGRLPDFICKEEIKSGKLVQVLSQYEMPAQSAYLVYPHRLHLSAKVRFFVDMAVEFFKRY